MLFLVGQHIRIFPQEDTQCFKVPASDEVYMVKMRRKYENGHDVYNVSHNGKIHDFVLMYNHRENNWFCQHIADATASINVKVYLV